jgi:RNA polymerase II subunit A small phosphatase-like protein
VRTSQDEIAHQSRTSTKKEFFLGRQSPRSKNKKTLVLDLDETLVHSAFKPPKDPSI